MPFASFSYRPQKILRLPKHPARLWRVSPDPSSTSIPADDIVRYSFTIEVNLEEAKRLEGYTLTLEALPVIPNPPKPAKPSIGILPRAFADSIATAQYQAEQFRKRVDATVFARKKVGLWRYMSSDARALPGAVPLSPKGIIPKFDRLGVTSFPNVSNFRATTKMPFENIQKVLPQLPSQDMPVRQEESAVKGAKSFSYNPKVYQFTGTTGKTKPDEKSVFRSVLKAGVDPASVTSAVKMPEKIGFSLGVSAASLIYAPPTIAPNPVSYLFQPTFTKIPVTIEVKRSLVDEYSTFYVRACLRSKGVPVTPYEKFPVPHAKLMNAYLVPNIMPILKAKNSRPGRVSLEVIQADNSAKRVKVFRRTCPISAIMTDSGSSWVEILDTQLSQHEKVSFYDNIKYIGNIMYRALSYGSNGKPGEEFASAIVRPIGREKPAGCLIANASFDEQSPTSPVTIRITDIPPGRDVTNVRLQRFDMTYDSERLSRQQLDCGFVHVEGNKTVEGLTEVVFVDSTIKPGRQYKYLPVGTSPTAGTVYGVPYILTVPHFTEEPIIALNVSPPRRLAGSDSVTEVELDLDAKFTDFGFNLVKETLSARGQEQLYNDQIQKNRSEFGKLISFTVERENHFTGDVESFGIVEPGKFTDDKKTRSERGIKEPEEGVEYSYSVTALINTPDYLFPRVLKQEIDSDTLTIVTKTLSKLSSPTTRQMGVIPSTAKQFDINAIDKIFPSDPRMSGITNVQKKFPFYFSPPSNTVKDLTVNEYADFNMISWSYDGDLSKLDHFRIELKSGGGSCIIDTVHCDPQSSSFYYRHKDVGYALDYQYQITPVSLSFTSVTSAITNVLRASMLGVVQNVDLSVDRTKATILPDFKFPASLGAIKL